MNRQSSGMSHVRPLQRYLVSISLKRSDMAFDEHVRQSFSKGLVTHQVNQAILITSQVPTPNEDPSPKLAYEKLISVLVQVFRSAIQFLEILV